MSTTATSPAGIERDVARAGLLAESLPYIQRWRNKVVVIKCGGNAMGDDELTARFAADVVLLAQVGIKPVVVHGGGPQIGELMERLGKQPTFVDGLRVTDAETLDIAQMVLIGKINAEMVRAINVHGALAVGVNGGDARLITATPRDNSLGFVGDVAHVDVTVVDRLLAEQLIPVVATIGSDASGQGFNINADTAAAALAAGLGAEKLIFLTDVAGLLDDPSDPETLVEHTTAAHLARLVDEPCGGTIAGGMVPKVTAAIDALAGDVGAVHMLDGRVPHVLLLELFTDAGVGTMITSHPQEPQEEGEQ